MVKKSSLLLAAVLLAFLAVVAGCTQPTLAPAKDSTPAAVSANAVTIQSFTFSPKILTVKAGTAVTWTNNDAAVHTIKSALFESSQLKPGQTFQYTFSQAGSYDYSCGIHPSMQGQVIVQE